MAEWQSVPYLNVPPSDVSAEGIVFRQSGDVVNNLHPALLYGHSFTVKQLNELMSDIGCAMPDQKKKCHLLEALARHVFPDNADMQAQALTACNLVKADDVDKPPSEALKLIVDELIMDPENADEAKALKKTWHPQEHAKTRNKLKAKLKEQIDNNKKLATIKQKRGHHESNPKPRPNPMQGPKQKRRQRPARVGR